MAQTTLSLVLKQGQLFQTRWAPGVESQRGGARQVFGETGVYS